MASTAVIIRHRGRCPSTGPRPQSDYDNDSDNGHCEPIYAGAFASSRTLKTIFGPYANAFLAYALRPFLSRVRSIARTYFRPGVGQTLQLAHFLIMHSQE